MNGNQKKENFEEDCFDRKDFADNLCNLIRYQEGYQSRVISIKADFGYGKTYFAKAFKNMIDSQDKRISPHLYCHYIDIWREDYNHNPLLALLSSLNEFVGEIDICKTTTENDFKNKLRSAVKTLAIELIKEGLSHIPIIGETTSKTIETFVNYEDISIFKDLNALKKIANLIKEAFAQFKNTSKMIVVIDEIDRCHPEYAIDFLETLKHFFDLENLYFIIMMNENHLKEKVKSKFAYINFEVWKDKFINLEFELPNAGNQEKFIKYLIYEKFQIQIQSRNIFIPRTGSKIKILRNAENNSLINEEKTDFVEYLLCLLVSLECKLNNRQLETVCLHLSIALDVLGDRPIYPIVLFGNILKVYVSNFSFSKKAKKDMRLEGFWFSNIKTQQEALLPEHSYFHSMGKILDFDLIKKHFPYLNEDEQKEVFDNILAAQFASQRKKEESQGFY